MIWRTLKIGCLVSGPMWLLACAFDPAIRHNLIWFAVFFFVVMPLLAYSGWGGWPSDWFGVVLYALAGIGLVAGLRCGR